MGGMAAENWLEKKSLGYRVMDEGKFTTNVADIIDRQDTHCLSVSVCH